MTDSGSCGWVDRGRFAGELQATDGLMVPTTVAPGSFSSALLVPIVVLVAALAAFVVRLLASLCSPVIDDQDDQELLYEPYRRERSTARRPRKNKSHSAPLDE